MEQSKILKSLADAVTDGDDRITKRALRADGECRAKSGGGQRLMQYVSRHSDEKVFHIDFTACNAYANGEAAAQAAGHVIFAAAFPHLKLARGVDAAFAGIETKHYFTEAERVPAPRRFGNR